MADPTTPVTDMAEEASGAPQQGVGIGVSGGGYRAMLFHLGAFLRLFEVGKLQTMQRISSVSGGSITVAKIGLEWPRLHTRDDFMAHVVAPIRHVASTTIDIPAVLWGLILPGGVGRQVAKRYRRYLFGDATLQDLPDDVRFVINATDLQSGKLWRFSKPYMRDYTVGRVDAPRIALADAVAASSAFPPVLAPVRLRLSKRDFSVVEPGIPDEMLENVTFGDGGVYDNLGLETVWKRYQTVLVSDAGVAVARNPDQKGDWARLGIRALDIIYGQVASLRTRDVIASYMAPPTDANYRTGAYWGIRSNIANYQLPDALPCPIDRTTELAGTPTRLKAMPSDYQERLINWGYAVCDAAVRKHWLPAVPPPPAPAWPYPATKV